MGRTASGQARSLCDVGAPLAGLPFLIESKLSQKQVLGDDLRALAK
jgi:hypothetical protein